MAPKKDPAQLSTNPRTVRERERRQKKTGFDEKYLKAQRADAAAIDYAKKKLKLSSEWLAANSEDQARQLAECAKKTTEERYVLWQSYGSLYILIVHSIRQKKHASTLQQDPNDIVQWDDPSELSDSDNNSFEEDEDENAEVIRDDQIESLAPQLQQIKQHQAKTLQKVIIDATRKFWKSTQANLRFKCDKLSTTILEDKLLSLLPSNEQMVCLLYYGSPYGSTNYYLDYSSRVGVYY